jgi:hypothetical protein
MTGRQIVISEKILSETHGVWNLKTASTTMAEQSHSGASLATALRKALDAADQPLSEEDVQVAARVLGALIPRTVER